MPCTKDQTMHYSGRYKYAENKTCISTLMLDQPVSDTLANTPNQDADYAYLYVGYYNASGREATQ